MSRRRFFATRVEECAAFLEGASAAHLARVLRAEPGQEFELAWQGRLYLGRVRRATAAEVGFDLVGELPAPPPPPPLALAAALFKFDRFEWMLEKATELGLSRLYLLNTRRVEPRLMAAAGKRIERWRTIVREAAEQSRRLDYPEILPLQRFDAFLAGAAAHSRCYERCVLTEPPSGEPLSPAQGPRLLLAGPEGGWTTEELEAAIVAGFTPISLGPRVLRCETALIAALARSA